MDVDMNSEDEQASTSNSVQHRIKDLDNMDDIDCMQLRHILLPRYLPPGNYDSLDIESGLMNQMMDTVQNLAEFLPPKTVELLKKLQNVHINCTPQTISDDINALQPGDSFAMFVRHQDCAIMLRVPPTENWNDVQNVIVATFPGSLYPGEIYLPDGDIEYNYPERAVKVRISTMLGSKEFADQLCALNMNPLLLENNRRDYVSIWLMSLLMDDKSTIATEEEFPIITKKIRDDALGDYQKIYFRRSGFYMCIKAIMQHSFTLKRGAIIGKSLYKIVMLKFLVNMCQPSMEHERFNIELLSHMIAKLARRIEKLATMEMEDHLIVLHDHIVGEAKTIISMIRKKIDNQIKEKYNSKKNKLSPLILLNFERDIRYKMIKLDVYLAKRGKIEIETQGGSECTEDTANGTYKRYFGKGLPKTKVIKKLTDVLELRIFWMDFERTILNDITLNDNSVKAKQFRTWSFAYGKYATQNYKNNKLSMSRMLLVLLKIIALLDNKVTKKYQRLLEHKCGIDPDVFGCLLLPQRHDMQIAYELEQYFRERNCAENQSLIDNKPTNKNSFGVKYAKSDPHMIETIEEILREDQKNIQDIQEEWNESRKRVDAFRNQVNSMKCDFNTRTKIHSRDCERCEVKRKADKMHLKPYERLLPENKNKQFAIVFELKIPTAIACLRDVLSYFVVFCNGEDSKKSPEIIWTDELDEYNESTSEYVDLGSTNYHPLEKIAIDSSATFSKFIVENPFNCVLFADEMPMPSSMKLKRIRKLCTFEATEEYSDLQWCLDSTQHTENQVLASQSKCSMDLTLSEYKNFGSLRADGHRLQLRKLYAMIETESLSFEKESVFALIMQTLWEYSESKENLNRDANSIEESNSIRESQIDFTDIEFCNAMIILLNRFVERQKSNWMHSFKLLTITLIAVRVFEINDSEAVAEKIVKLLRKIRSIAAKWIDEIEKLIGKLANPDEKTESSLRLKLIYIAAIGGLTFFVHPKHKYFSMIFENNQSIQWLGLVICLKNNVRMHTNDEKQLPSNLIMLLRLIESVGMSVQDKVKELIYRQDLNDLVKCLWPRSADATFKEMRAHPDMEHILMVVVELDSRDQIVTIDIITGTFLVNNLPPSRLPNQIIDSPLYQWFFGNVVLQVQPHAQRTFSALRKYNGCTYEFETINDQIIITEKKDNEFEKELIDPSIFDKEFPFTLIYNFTHWWNKADKCIEFRKKASKYTHFSKETTIEYRLSLETCHLIHEPTKRPMLYVFSSSYEKITKQLARLEHSKYIHIFYLADKEEAQVELLRMNLKFTVKFLGKKVKTHLTSNEFSGMIVCQSQYIGTLNGLNHGLILKSATDSDTTARKILLIPNGHISIKSVDNFASVQINTQGELQSPPFYQYQVDTFCQQLKSSNGSYASWFYLAYLHAITSHGEVDTFTGMSGTERALQILQSSFAWSSSPCEDEAFKILLKIAELTPLRKVENYAQRIQWPKHIPACAAQDCFVFIAKKLLADSQRLHTLHGGSWNKRIDLATQLKYNERSHRRYQQLHPNLRVSDSIIASKKVTTSPAMDVATEFCDDTRTVCILYHNKQFNVPRKSIKRFLSSDVKLDGLEPSRVKDFLFHLVDVKLRNLWITLYDAIVNLTLSSEHLAVILSFYAHCGEDIKQILILQTIAANADRFRSIKVPKYKSFHRPAITFNSEQVFDLLKEHISIDSEESLIDSEELLQQSLEIKLRTITDDIASRWPCSSVDIINKWNVDNIDFVGANNSINKKLEIWYANHELHEFIKKVENTLNSLAASGVSRLRVPSCDVPKLVPIYWPQVSIDYDKKMRDISKTFIQDIQRARNIFKMETSDPPAFSAQYWWTIFKKICKSNEVRHLVEAGLFPRIVPSLILSKLLYPQLDDDLRCVTGAYAMAIAHEQRKNRIDEYKRRPEMKAALEREEQNIPHENWKPCDYPEWLLFEIEQNLTIRRIQIEVAKRMIDPPQGETKHSVMQLNMGEGKTAVIVPIIAARLADGTQACQIVVLKSLFATNLKSLRQYLGGFLNRRIYVFPCRRDMPIGAQALEMLSIYEECQREKGVILTLPEYLLSFQLKIYESISVQLKIADKDDRDFEKAKNLLKMFKWMNSNMRTVLDESDAILHAMYQLVYTMGKQFQPDGGSQRWTVAQTLLKCVPSHMKTLYNRFGSEKIEFGQSYGTHMDFDGRPDVFTPCRILDETVFDALSNLLIEDFLDGRIDLGFPVIDDEKKNSIRKILKCKEIDKITFRVIELFSADHQDIIFILSGLLRFEILKLALTKRWRVNYGVDGNGKRKMAIPFKAKDVAAENTEFGHPDVAVCFTQMSYYYSGLTNDQLYQVFHNLENSPDASNIYEKWINGIPNKFHIESLATYRGINLDDSEQRNLLFPLLQYNMDVINFWLSKVVYPHELKVFEKKLMCTSWDLCSEHIQRPVSGFSGTNDTKNTLPLTITQNDLQELEHTNEQMRQILLDTKNQVYQTPSIVNGKDVLKTLVDSGIRVLLDSGALMLELNNKQVAIEWLKMATDCSAAVYFDEQDTLQTIDRNNIVSEFGYSVHRENLSKCVVYLDDAHTRGTDLKFPMDWTACVTLSGDITRDKTVQSCMRMRQLATTQSILFWPSYEANVRLQALSRQSRVECKHVMEFIEENSRKFETSNMVHWTTAALNYTKKMIGHKLYETESDENKFDSLYNACVDDDFVKLEQMFGEKGEAKLTLISYNEFNKLAMRYMENSDSSVVDLIERIRTAARQKLNTYARNVTRFTHALDEEQEKELEQETEEQTQIHRPPNATPAKPKFDKNLALLVSDGVGAIFDNMKANGALLSIGASLSNRQTFDDFKNNVDAWADDLFVTKDFNTIIDSESQAGNDILRAVCWIARINNINDRANDILVILSSFECNQLLPAFRKSKNATLFMYRARLGKLYSNLIHESCLQVTGGKKTNKIKVEDEVQIAVYAGSMYFDTEAEQDAYCGFLGLVPKPWTREQKEAHDEGIIDDYGFVPVKRRNYVEEIAPRIKQCKFTDNPRNLAIELVKTHHQFLPKDSHAASILSRGTKVNFTEPSE